MQHIDEATAAVRQDRRREKRLLQAGRVVQLVIGDTQEAFALVNLSAGGASGHAGEAAHIGSFVALDFGGGTRIAGRVRWRRATLIGIEFFQQLPRELLHPGDTVRVERERRISVARSVWIRAGEHYRSAIVRNISSRGARVETFGTLDVHQQVTLVAGTLVRQGEVRWARNNHAGIRLFDPLCLDTFDAATREATPTPAVAEPDGASGGEGQ